MFLSKKKQTNKQKKNYFSLFRVLWDYKEQSLGFHKENVQLSKDITVHLKPLSVDIKNTGFPRGPECKAS